jgi:Na+/proline symporter
MQFLLNLPTPISFLIISAIATSVALGGLHLVRRKYPAEVLKENHEVAAVIFNAFGLLYAVVVAFVVFVTWSGYDDATKNLEMEANEVADIFHSTQAFPDPTKKIIQQGLVDYAASVYNNELKRMSYEQIGLRSDRAMSKLLTAFYQIDDRTISNRELYGDTLKRLNDLAQYRRLRIFAGNDTVPAVIWFVLLVGGVITVGYTYFFGMKSLKAQSLTTVALTVTISLILFLIYVLDHPFTGASKVNTEPLKEVLSEMQKESAPVSIP